jgi:HK97 family phage major capsid protein
VNPEAYNVLAQMTFVNQAGTVTTYPAFGGVSYNANDDKFPMRIFGKPVIEWQGLPQLGEVGDIILTDLTQLVTAEKPQLFADVSNDYAFNTLQVAFRFYRRYDIRSPWTAALTSVDGHYSYSPFIALQARGT